jgi:hypothetical protein
MIAALAVVAYLLLLVLGIVAHHNDRAWMANALLSEQASPRVAAAKSLANAGLLGRPPQRISEFARILVIARMAFFLLPPAAEGSHDERTVPG